MQHKSGMDFCPSPAGFGGGDDDHFGGQPSPAPKGDKGDAATFLCAQLRCRLSKAGGGEDQADAAVGAHDTPQFADPGLHKFRCGAVGGIALGVRGGCGCHVKPGWVGQYVVEGLGGKGQGGGIAPHRRNAMQAIDIEIFIGQRHQSRLALYANAMQARHTRTQAQQRRTRARTGFQNPLARARRHDSRQQNRLESAAMTVSQLPVINAVSEQTAVRHPRHDRLPLSQIRWIWW